MHVNQPGRFGRTSRNRFDLHQRAACSIGFRTVVLMLDRAMLQRAPLLGFQAVHLPRPCLVILNRDEINYHPQSGWYDESPQRGLDTKALLTSSAPDVSPLAPGS